MHFLVDAQLPPALAKWLIGQGHVAAHVFELGLERADDRRIWDRALELGAVIVTKSWRRPGRASFGSGSVIRRAPRCLLDSNITCLRFSTHSKVAKIL